MFSYTAKLKCYDAHVCQLVPLISFEGPQHLEVLVGDRKSMQPASHASFNLGCVKIGYP
jgi:hypothetical protein